MVMTTGRAQDKKCSS